MSVSFHLNSKYMHTYYYYDSYYYYYCIVEDMALVTRNAVRKKQKMRMKRKEKILQSSYGGYAYHNNKDGNRSGKRK